MSVTLDAGLAQRFYSKTKREGACWVWTGSRNDDGYGQFGLNGKSVRAHRLSFTLSGRVIPEGMQLDHICRNRACVNPDHLRVVTNRENALCGVGATARNARKTHCPKGHPLAGENLHPSEMKRGFRVCRTCRQEQYANRNAARRVRRTE